MKVVFVSNFMNHHQIALCDSIFDRLNEDFIFIATEEIPEERVELGYRDLNYSRDYICRAYEEHGLAQKKCAAADVMLIGSASDEYIRNFDKSKIILRYSERPYKDHSKFRALLSEIKHHYRFINRNIYVLCASAYTATDHAKYGIYRNRFYKWGYFPEVRRYDMNDLLTKKRTNEKCASILWVGRLITWKHPELALQIAKTLKNDGYAFKMNIIGNGEMEAVLREMIIELELQEDVCLLGSMPQESVREWMEKADIFLFTSDRNEGWGAVLNEAMNSGCAVVANNAIGSVPFLIRDGENGMIYQDGNLESLYAKVKYLIDDTKFRNILQAAAYETMLQEWSPEIAAGRLLELLMCLKTGSETPYQKGPCSRAEVLKEGKI